LKKQIDSLTPLRGIAAVLVVVLHYSGAMLPNLDFSVYTNFFSKGYLWVDFFLVLSGFIMSHAYGKRFADGVSQVDFKKFMFARFTRIYPLHLFILSLFIGYELVKFGAHIRGGQSGGSPFTGITGTYPLVTNLFLAHSLNLHNYLTWNIPSWSISVEWYMYLIFPFLVPFVHKMSNIFKTVVYGLCICGLYVLSASVGGHLDITYNYGFIRCFFEFISGMILYHVYAKDVLSRFFSKSIALVIPGAVAFSIMHFGINDVFAVPVFAVIILAAAHSDGVAARCLNLKPMNYLGEISYSIYLSHAFLQLLIPPVYRIIFGSDIGVNLNELQSIGMLLVLVFVVCAFSSFTYHNVEIRAKNFLVALAKRRREKKVAVVEDHQVSLTSSQLIKALSQG